MQKLPAAKTSPTIYFASAWQRRSVGRTFN